LLGSVDHLNAFGIIDVPSDRAKNIEQGVAQDIQRPEGEHAHRKEKKNG
jgi:hypothetical protein